MKSVSLSMVAILLLMAQPRRVSQEDEILNELRSVREDHKKMMGQITVNTQRLTDMERRAGEVDHAQLAERLAKVEGEFAFMLALGLATFGTLVSSCVWIFRNLIGAKRHGTLMSADLGELKQALKKNGSEQAG